MPSAKKPIDPTIRSLRESANMKTKDVAERMRTVRSALSRRETSMRVQDHTIAWLRSYVRACGGDLEIVIRINDRTIEL
jgi:transcriptional regulator with XRE-family HTH domain